MGDPPYKLASRQGTAPGEADSPLRGPGHLRVGHFVTRSREHSMPNTRPGLVAALPSRVTILTRRAQEAAACAW